MMRSVSPAHPEFERYKGQTLGDKSQRLELNDLISAYCINSAYQCWLEGITGSLEKGKSADFVILDRDIRAIPAEEISELEVVQTYFKGRLVYERG